MAIEFDASNAGNTEESVTSFTVPITVNGAPGNAVLYAVVAIDTNVDFTPVTCTYNSVPMAQIHGDRSSHPNIWVFELINPATGAAYDCVATLANEQRYWSMCVASYTGVDQSTPRSNAIDTVGNSQLISGVIASTPGDLVVDLFSWNNVEAVNTSAGVGQAQRELEQAGGAGGILAGISDKPGAASVTMSWSTTNSARPWKQYKMSLNPAGVAGPSIQLLRRRGR